MEKGVTFKELSENMVLDYLEELKGFTIKETQFDLGNVFRGLKMKPARYVSQLSSVAYEYVKSVNDRKNKMGLESRFASGDRELAKMAFPSLIKGIWPSKAASILHKRWKAEGKQWKLSDLIKEIRTTVNTYGVYELEREIEIRSDRENKRSKREFDDRGARRSKEVTFGLVSKSIMKKPERQVPKSPGGYSSDGGKYNRSKGSDLTCYRCGIKGHTRPECRLPEDHPKVVALGKGKPMGKIRRLQDGEEDEKADHESESCHSIDQEDSDGADRTTICKRFADDNVIEYKLLDKAKRAVTVANEQSVNIVAELVEQIDIRMGSNGNITVRNVPIWIIEEDMDEILLGEDVLIKLGINVRDQLKRRGGIDIDYDASVDDLATYPYLGGEDEQTLRGIIIDKVDKECGTVAEKWKALLLEHLNEFRTTMSNDPAARVKPMVSKWDKDRAVKVRPARISYTKEQKQFLDYYVDKLIDLGFVYVNPGFGFG
ncbi:MAG: hypothetical protein SGARI_000114 [Bacillariaceae sp.]